MRRCYRCDKIIKDQDPVYCAADFNLLQKEHESELATARTPYALMATNYPRLRHCYTLPRPRPRSRLRPRPRPKVMSDSAGKIPRTNLKRHRRAGARVRRVRS